MSSLEEVFKGVDAFVKDMEELGLDVRLTVINTPAGFGPRGLLNLTAIVRKELGEDLEI